MHYTQSIHISWLWVLLTLTWPRTRFKNALKPCYPSQTRIMIDIRLAERSVRNCWLFPVLTILECLDTDQYWLCFFVHDFGNAHECLICYLEQSCMTKSNLSKISKAWMSMEQLRARLEERVIFLHGTNVVAHVLVVHGVCSCIFYTLFIL